MTPAVNHRVVLAARPVGFPRESDFRIEEAPAQEPADGQFLVRVLYLSLDPYMRGRMSAVKSYAANVELGEVMVGGAVGRVVASRNERFAVGDAVVGHFGWQEYATSDGAGVEKIDESLAPISTAVGVLGMPGLTAYFGLLEIGRPRPGETVVVSAAAGAVGAVVGQIAKIKGCRVVGIAGSPEKVAYVRDQLGFDAAIDYRAAPDMSQALAEACPRGVDVYFDNVGGETLDAVLRHINMRARIAICGMISEYNLEKPAVGPRPGWFLLVNRARMEGFLVFEFRDRYREGLAALAAWVREGHIKYKEDIVEGLAAAPRAFIGLMQGKNFGKLLVRVGKE
ncbi:MAG: NADP-dependent oxidoreductase [Planctomycetia bacterium]|nr:NADP-dependent oxidoreductase [Planctomycetia bacterium]